MSFLKKSDRSDHRFGSGDTSRHSLKQAGRAERPGWPEIEPKPNTQPFDDNFYLEHSFSAVSITLKAISASSAAVELGTPGKRRVKDLNLPACLYIG
jgi:hypothetical protein